MPTDLDRKVLIHICKDRTLSYRVRKERIFNGIALPVLSVNSIAEAEALFLLVGRRQYTEHPQMPGRIWYKMTLPGTLDFKRHLDIDDLDTVTNCLRERYALIKKEGERDA